MIATSITFILAAFLLGFVLGALLVAIERSARIERLKQQFQADLEAMGQRIGQNVTKTEPESASRKAHSDPTRAA